jgi:predicted nucleic acid-binding Zn ribbon protein
MSISLRLDSWTPARRTAKDKVLADWRGVDVMPLALAREDRTRSAEALMAKVLKGIGLDRKRSEAEIVKVWNNLIDPTITAHAQPNSLHKGTLFVCVDNNVWLSEIVRYRRHEILQRLQHGFGSDVIQRVSYRIG